MKAHYIYLPLCCAFFITGCTDKQPASTEKPAIQPENKAESAIEEQNVTPPLFSERFNQRMHAFQKNFRIEENPKIKIGPNLNTFQSNPTHHITIIGTLDKKTGHVINAMLVARGNDDQGMENIIIHAIGMIAAYNPEITADEARKEVSELVAAYDPRNGEPISKNHRKLKLTYGMQADMGLSHFSVRPANGNN